MRTTTTGRPARRSAPTLFVAVLGGALGLAAGPTALVGGHAAQNRP